jgi:hypothetical protein
MAGLLLSAPPAQAQTAPDFAVSITVSDGPNGSPLVIGTNAAASDGFDSGLDGPAPPAPPSTAFDTRIDGPGEGLFTDLRAPTTDPITFTLTYRAAEGEGPVTLSWDPSQFPSAVQATVTETGQSLTATSSLDTSTDPALADGLTIEVDVITPPAAPSALNATPASGTAIDLDWTDNADDEAAVEVEHSTSGSAGPFTSLATLGANATSYTHTGLALNSEHCYRVRATNAAGLSAWSSVACATTPSGTLSFAPAQVDLSVQAGNTDQASATLSASPSAPGSIPLSADAAWLSVPATAAAGSSVPVSVDAAGLSAGSYTGTVTATAPDFADATLTVALTVTPAIITDFMGQLTVTDDNGAAKTLQFGTSPNATDGVDALYDQKAPPPPPQGAFDARLDGPTADLYADFRATNTSTVSWTVQFVPADGGAPITLDWSDSTLPTEGRFALSGPGVSIDMRSQTTYTVTDLTVEAMTITYSLTSLVDVAATAGWNLVGLPLDVADPAYTAVFNALSPQQAPFRFSGTYESAPTLALGEGYWLDAQSGGVQSVEGYDVESITLSLNDGWNLIAGPSCGVPLAAVSDPSGVIDPSTLYAFDQVYSAATAIAPGAGYWVEASADADVTLSCAAAKQAPVAAASTPADHALLTVRATGGAAQTLHVGPAASGRSYAMPPRPPAGAFDVRFADDTRLLAGEEGRVELQGASFPLTVALKTQRDDVPADDGGYLVEALVDGTVVAAYTLAKAGDHATVRDPAVTSLRVRVQAPLAERPGSFALRGNVPNPFQTSTRIVFDLPDNAVVTLAVYDMLGRRLLTQEAEMAAGLSRSLFVSGQSLSSGNYFYRLRAEMDDRSAVTTGRFSVVQ